MTRTSLVVVGACAVVLTVVGHAAAKTTACQAVGQALATCEARLASQPTCLPPGVTCDCGEPTCRVVVIPDLIPCQHTKHGDKCSSHKFLRQGR